LQYKLLEGEWTFLFIGYKRSKKLVTCYALFKDKTNLKTEMINVMHYPLGEFVAFYLGGSSHSYTSF